MGKSTKKFGKSICNFAKAKYVNFIFVLGQAF